MSNDENEQRVKALGEVTNGDRYLRTYEASNQKTYECISLVYYARKTAYHVISKADNPMNL